MSEYIVFKENFAANTWEPLPNRVLADTPERAVRHTFSGPVNHGADIFGTYVAIPGDEVTQFMEGRPRTVISAHIETLQPEPVEAEGEQQVPTQ